MPEQPEQGEQAALELELAAAVSPGARGGFRLERLEVLNWGTFHKRVFSLRPRGDSALLTGDIGSGKSTLVDAVITLLVPPQRLAYNKAAEAETRERTLRSYVLGYYKKERGESGSGARPVALREHDSYSVILAVFHHQQLGQRVTLAQVFWLKDAEGQPERLYVVADDPLGITEHFSGFGPDISGLRKRLRKLARAEVADTFPPYGAALRRRFGIESEQALELLHQTVSMKSVGNLTEFVRQHMLEPFPVEGRVQALLGHYDDLNRTHQAVLRARAQIERLDPLCADCDRHDALQLEVTGLTAARDALRAFFARLKGELLDRRIAAVSDEVDRAANQGRALDERRRDQRAKVESIRLAIRAAGGDRIERIRLDIDARTETKDARHQRAVAYSRLAREVGFPMVADSEVFVANRRAIDVEREVVDAAKATEQNLHTEASVRFARLREEHTELESELASLRSRRSNIPARMLTVRERLRGALGVAESELPFVGELVAVREEERGWEGAIERLLHGFGTSILVGDEHYLAVAEWVDRIHLGERLVYFRVRAERAGVTPPAPASGPTSLARKLSVKPDSPFYGWLESEVARRFDHVCCESIDQLRREARAITRNGQIKGGGERHEKDDRHRVDDRSRYVLGWSNEAKIADLERKAAGHQRRMQAVAQEIAASEERRGRLEERLKCLHQLAGFESFRELDWKPLVTEIEQLQSELRELEGASDLLRALDRQLGEAIDTLAEIERGLDDNHKKQAAANYRLEEARRLKAECESVLAAAAESLRAAHFPPLESMRVEALGERAITVESADNREKDFREWLQARIDAEKLKIDRLRDRVVSAMSGYRKDYPVETQEADASLEAAGEFRAMLVRLRTDDLPRFARRFKEALNENTIREIAGFQSQLHRERQSIRERIAIINRSLRGIDYNPGRYIVLDELATTDADVREFQQDLRACTEGALSGSEDEAYSEAKFLQVKRIIERFRGREGTAELDRRWTRKVTDVRAWFTFSATERWREDDREHEHYPDSGGKSGGQKEKLAYTVLGASLAYQFGLEP